MLRPAMLDPVYFAAVEGDSPLLERLLTEGRSTEVKGLNGFSAIGAAAERGHEEVVRQLLLFRANVQAVDKFGSTPLHEAAKGGHGGVVGLLLASNADVDARSPSSLLPVHYAAMYHHEHVSKALSLGGSEQSPVCIRGTTPADYRSDPGFLGRGRCK